MDEREKKNASNALFCLYGESNLNSDYERNSMGLNSQLSTLTDSLKQVAISYE